MTKVLGHYRLASLAAGDDVTFTRYVRADRATAPRRKNQPRLPGLEAAYIQEGRTKFPKSVKPVAAMKHLLVSGHSNVKIGRDVRVGARDGEMFGKRIYTLSLEERKTCPRSCQHWQTCYGNNMPYAKRIDHTDPDFLPRLENEIAELLLRPSHADGILVRLHALGDFYSVEYVHFWRRMLSMHPRLAIYGYTARKGCRIGDAIGRMNVRYEVRSMIRYSDGEFGEMDTIAILDETSTRPAKSFICPEQTGKTLGCGTCGACWATKRTVAFMEH